MTNESKSLIRSCCEDVSFIEDINKTLPLKKELLDITSIFKALSDPTRVKILFALLKYEICVGEMSNLLELPQSHVSHQLKVLREKKIVKFKKEKKMSFYSIYNEEVKTLITLALKSVKAKDDKRNN